MKKSQPIDLGNTNNFAGGVLDFTSENTKFKDPSEYIINASDEETAAYANAVVEK